jgi:hypothetical protein
MRWLRRILLCVAILLVIALLLVAGGWWQVHRTPEWYPVQLSDAERDAAAERALNAWVVAQNRIAEAHARQLQIHDAGNPAATQRALDENRPIQISFSAAELNAFFQKWSSVSGWEQRLAQYLHNPQIVLHDGRLILAGEMRDLGFIGDVKASAHFEPRMTAQGQLDLRLVRMMGGAAPLPQSLWDSQKTRLLEAIKRRLPALQQQARFAPDGDANSQAVAAAMSKLLLQVLNHQPSEPVVFLPLSAGGVANRQIPVRVLDIQIKPASAGGEQRLTLTVAPMTAGERTAFLQRLREPYSTATAGLME